MTTNALYILVGLALLTMRLLNDFQRDKGQNKKAKTFQAICLGVIIVSYATSLRYVGWLFRHFDEAQTKFSVDVGIVPGQVHFMIFILNIAFMTTVLILSYLIASRNLKALRLLFYFLPLLALTETFNVYRGWLSDGEELEINHGIIFLIGFIIFGGLTTGILLIYNSKFMKEFFTFKGSSTVENKIDGHTNS